MMEGGRLDHAQKFDGKQHPDENGDEECHQLAKWSRKTSMVPHDKRGFDPAARLHPGMRLDMTTTCCWPLRGSPI